MFSFVYIFFDLIVIGDLKYVHKSTVSVRNVVRFARSSLAKYLILGEIASRIWTMCDYM